MEDSSRHQRILETVKQFQLLLWPQHEDLLEKLSRSGNIDEAVNINIDKSCHQKLTVKSVHDATMSGNNVSKVLDLKSSFKSRGKEATKRTDD